MKLECKAVGCRSLIRFTFELAEYLFSISFAPSELKIIYTAEAKEEPDGTDPFLKYRFVPDFGESYSGKKRPAVYLFSWQDQGKPSVAKISLISHVVPEVLVGHAVFVAEDRIIAVGYKYSKDGRLLGVIYCPNRAAALLDITLPDAALPDSTILQCTTSQLTPHDVSCRSPRVLQSIDNHPALLVWLSNPAGGPHATCSSLHTRDISTGETRTLVQSVWDPKTTEFPGLYLNTLPAAPFLVIASQSYIVLSSTWQSRSTVLIISLEDGELKDLTPDEDGTLYSWTVLCTDGKAQLVCTRSAPTRPPELLLGRISDDNRVQWRTLAAPNLGDQCECSIEKSTDCIN